MAATAEDQARLLVSIEATQAKFSKQLSQIARDAGSTANGIERDFQRANDNSARAFDRGGRAAARGLGQARAAGQQLSFQLNDIATGLLSGVSPFTIMAQQGGQVAQIINGAGGVKGSLGALRGAIAGLINPAGLLSVALIGVTGYAVQFFAEMVSGGEDSAKVLEKQAELIQKVANKYGDSMPALKAYADEIKRAADEQERLAAAQAAIKDIRSPVAAQAALVVPPAIGAVSTDLQQIGVDAVIIDDLRAAWDKLNAKMQEGKASAEDVRLVEQKLFDLLGATGLDSVAALAGQFTALRTQMEELDPAAKKIEADMTRVALSMDEAKKLGALLVSELAGLGGQGTDAIVDIAKAFTSNLLPSLQAAIDKTSELLRQYKAVQDQLNAQPLGVLSPVTSGGGQFLNSDGNPLQQSSKAAQLIRDKEKFSSNAYWDVNAYRAGYGSDTTTDANGMVQRVTAQTVTTIADAERDLTRRLGEFQSGIKQAIGPETWQQLNEAQQAALTSIAYNYGSLPKSIVAAIEKGGGPEVVAQAIQRLAGDNGGINAGRRMDEAQLYMGGAVPAATEAKARETAAVRENTAAARENNDAWAGLRQVTGQATQTVDQNAAAYERLGQVANTALSGLANALADGKLEAGELLQILISVVQQLLTMPAIGGAGAGGGLGGLFSSIFGSLFGAKDGGHVLALAGGGKVRGPGGPRGDKILARLSDGEHVTNARSAKKYRALLDAINSDSLPGYADGSPQATAQLPWVQRIMPPGIKPIIGRGAELVKIHLDAKVNKDGGMELFVDQVADRKARLVFGQGIKQYDTQQAPRTAVSSVQAYQQRA